MKILFSPSEAKSDFSDFKAINKNSMLFPELFEKRLYVINKLNFFLKNSKHANITKFFGIKDEEELKKLASLDLLDAPTCKAIYRYTGVAYKYLDFHSLDSIQKDWLEKNTIIFSNLFGPLLAKDYIPYYRFKQASSLEGFKPEIYYKENFSDRLDDFIDSELVIDLRAGFYEKFYKLTSKHITMKFIKNGKVVSHWAKAYRGLVLRELAKQQPSTIEEFDMIDFKGLHVKEIIDKKSRREYIFDIVQDKE